MSLQTQLAELLSYVRDQHLSFRDHLTEVELHDIGAEDKWSAKDILIHNAVWADRRLDELEAAERDGRYPPLHYGDYEEANRGLFRRHQDCTWRKALAMVRTTYARADAFLWRVDEAFLVQTPEGQPAHEVRINWRGLFDGYVNHPMFHLWDFLEAQQHLDALPVIFSEQYFAWVEALDTDPQWRGANRYNQACIYALAGEKQRAIQALTAALRLRPTLSKWSKEDRDLVSIRAEPAYQALYT